MLGITPLEKACIEKVEFYINKANKLFNVSMVVPAITFDIRGTNAGEALLGRNRIRFNGVLLRENGQGFINDTPGHEVGHFVARYLNQNKHIDPHGQEWSVVMMQLGLPPVRCHRWSTRNVPAKVAKRMARTIVIQPVKWN